MMVSASAPKRRYIVVEVAIFDEFVRFAQEVSLWIALARNANKAEKVQFAKRFEILQRAGIVERGVGELGPSWIVLPIVVFTPAKVEVVPEVKRKGSALAEGVVL